MQKYPATTLCVLLTTSIGIVWITALAISAVKTYLIEDKSELNWIFRFLFTILGYATVFAPGYIIVKYAQKHNLHKLDGVQWKIVHLLLTGNASQFGDIEKGFEELEGPPVLESEHSFSYQATCLVICCVGLQASYLLWGILQEKIMTRSYIDGKGNVEKFTDSQFLVFVNRILAFALSGLYLLLTRQPRHRTPLYKYSYCSVSNTLSSWCQYEALKFVSFPTQVLAKSAKVIPVMLMGKLIFRSKFKAYEYTTAILISIGMAAFLLGSSEGGKGNTVTTFSGVLLLCGYLVFDSFTANWQSALFKEHQPSSVQMMCGVNLMSCLLTAVPLLQQGGFLYSIGFAARYPRFIFDCVITAITSASGQLFIFATIANFGPVVFTIIMTVRQGLSILLSCIIYEHQISSVGVIGVFTVFMAIFLRIYYGQQHKKRKVASDNNSV